MTRNGYKKIINENNTKKLSILSLLLFQWMNNTFKTGNEQTLDENDFLPLSEKNTTCFVTEQLQIKWDEEITDCKGKGKKPRLWKCVMKILSVKDVIFLFFIWFINTFTRILEPLLLGYFMASLLSVGSQRIYRLYGCALAMVINVLIRSLSGHQVAYRCELLGIRISSALKGLIFKKVSYRRIFISMLGLISGYKHKQQDSPQMKCTQLTKRA